MDLKAVEAALTEVGKTFRLSRLYPPTHPSVQQSLAELAAALPAITSRGKITLRIGATGFFFGETAVASRNPQLAELAGMLFSHNWRRLLIEPGVSPDEFGVLARSLAAMAGRQAHGLGAHAKLPPFPHIKLLDAAQARVQDEADEAEAEPTVMGRRTLGVFRPDALPADIEATRILSMLELAAPAEAPRHLARLPELAAQLLAQREFSLYAKAIAVLARWAVRADAAAGEAAQVAQRGLETAVTPEGLAALVGRLAEPGVSAAERDALVQTLGALGARAVTAVAEAFGAADAEHRDLMLAVVRLAGEAAIPPLLARMDWEARGEPARSLALLLGATRRLSAAPPLYGLARHPDAPVRAAAITSLARLEMPEAQRAVVGALRDPDAEVRIAAARGIHWFGDASVVPNLLANLASEEDPEVISALVAALGELRDARAVNHLADLANAVSGVFQRRSPVVRAAAVRALGAIGTEDALAIVESFRHDRQQEVRRAAVEVVGE